MNGGKRSIDWQSPEANGPASVSDVMDGTTRALVADDNAHVLHATSDLIAEYGVEVVSRASNVDDAIRAAERDQPDVAFIEAFLKGGGAEVAARRIRSVSPATSIVVLASVNHVELDLKMRAAGAHGCYEKQTLSAVLPEILVSIRRP